MRFLLSALLFALLPLNSAAAADGGMSPLNTIVATDGKAYSPRFAAGLSLDNGVTFGTAGVTDVDLLIQGSISPDPAHVGKKGDLFVVERINGSFYMRNTEGVYVPWPTVSVRDLVPAVEDVTLTPSHLVEVYRGKISEAADHRVFLGYMAEGVPGLIYTGVPLLLNIARNTDPLSLFQNNIFAKIVIGKCALCHVRGGVADGRAALLFVRDSTKMRENFDIFKTFFDTRKLTSANTFDYILSKTSGGDRHVGGAQLAKGSADYNALQTFLTVLDGRMPVDSNTASPSAQFFTGVTLQSNLQTLRRAAILLAGRAPTAAEQAAVASGGDAELRATLRGLMQGQNFHDFLKDAANDRLLVRGNLLPPILPCQNCFPEFSRRLYLLHENSFLTGMYYPAYDFMNQISYAQEEAPLELIARIVENDLPYSEIVTADYTMVNPVLDSVMPTTATFTTASHTEFKPGRSTDYYRIDASQVTRQETRFDYPIIVNPGNLRGTYPHVGLLNDMAFMARYPSTATNRNRARARWTFFHFLGVDIEQSAQRTTDPVALADTNNPTMNNPNCQVCHEIMDPVAGAFQHYGDDGHYLESWGGMDALDQYYKFPENGGSTLYRAGDTWYRDMRAPGFNGTTASGTDTLRWLANQIAADPRFATAAVRFWWPAIIGRELLKRPEVATDGDYEARLLAYDAQEASIAAMASAFTQSGMKVKSLLLELLMSEWFRAERIDASKVSATQTQAHWIAGLGNEKLLTPEQLARKTKALTGFSWQAKFNVALGFTIPGLRGDYAMYYGGVDSMGVTRRARELTPLMSATALTMGLESSCPIVYGEFILPDADRKLFSGITPTLTPLTEGAELKVADSQDRTEFRTFSAAIELGTGAKKAFVSFLNNFCDWDAAASRCRTQRSVSIATLTVQQPDGTRTTVRGPQLQLETHNCGRELGGNMYFYDVCMAAFRFDATQPGVYQVEAQIAVQQAGAELVQLALGFEADSLPAQSTARGALQIRQKLVELHQNLLGETLAVDSPEISAAFTLLTDTWQAKRASTVQSHMMTPGVACNWAGDVDYLSYVGYPGNSRVLKTTPIVQLIQAPPWSELSGWYYPKGADPVHMKKSWQVVIAYLLTHYNYLYE